MTDRQARSIGLDMAIDMVFGARAVENHHRTSAKWVAVYEQCGAVLAVGVRNEAFAHRSVIGRRLRRVYNFQTEVMRTV